ncbi:HAD family hydrolase [Natronolimnobius baerhuensis]|uniref:Hydrolase n=1 Tax=Natronolimnobius baerhuensis TaxID=253108 RepID=A0A202E877_9EURY|nr:HAD-IA family hydrolase [Natronolimnobius baerhuensis]OVE84461.1 hydrolase [Natronolimnobius baerhuensis]
MGANTYDAVIFDNDGVLTTPTEYDVLVQAMQTALENVSEREPTDEHLEELISPSVASLRQVAETHAVEPETLWHAREQAAIAAQRAEITAGRKRLYDDVAALERLAVPQAIVSNNQHETIRNILEHLALDGFEVWYGREPTIQGIQRKKPNAYYLESAIDELGVSNPLYVGDSRVDVTAAEKAGIDAAFIRREHRHEYELPTTPAHEIHSLEGLVDLF